MQEQTYSNHIKYKEEEYWFEIGRKKIFSSILDKTIDRSNLNILEAGCGTGEMMEYFKKFGNVKGIEKYLPYSKISREKGFEVSNMLIEDFPIRSEKFDIISFFDVLEHIDDDNAVLDIVYKLLNDSGLVVISVPALPIVWGQSDIAGNHKRRYRKKELKKKLEKSGFKIIKLTYFNHYLFPLIFLILLAKRIFTLNHLIKTKPNHEYGRGNKFLTGLLKKIFCKEADVLKDRDFKFGLSLFAIGKKI